MEYTFDAIPAQFWRVKYDQDHDGGAPLLPSISESPNCQNFAYALLKHFGYEISPFRSSNLWEDAEETVIVTGELRALDLLLFNRTSSKQERINGRNLAIRPIPDAYRISDFHRGEATTEIQRS